MDQQLNTKPATPAKAGIKVVAALNPAGGRQGIRVSITSSDYKGGVFWLEGWSHQCCGLGEMGGILAASALMEMFGEEEILRAMLNAQQHQHWVPWNWVYALADYQLSNSFHSLMLRCGAVPMGEPFNNEAHGPHTIQLFRVNFKNFLTIYTPVMGYEGKKSVYQQLILKDTKNAVNTAIAQTVTAKPHQAVAVPALGG